MGGGNTEPKIIASRGRGIMNEQHAEPRKDGLTNTITSVQKDNYLAEPCEGGANRNQDSEQERLRHGN